MESRYIAVTGSRGLIGRALVPQIRTLGFDVVELDRRAAPSIDVRDVDRVHPIIAGATGIIHLAAVSRVIWGQQDPALCHDVNVEGTRGILRSASQARTKPWVLFASSREVYGQQAAFPVSEDAPFQPLNYYAQSKVTGEELVRHARASGMRTATVRFSSVYGSIHDHEDRVVPAFAAAAGRGETLRVDGTECVIDITHVDDVCKGMATLISTLVEGETKLPDIHFVSGVPVRLGELASRACEIAATGARIEIATPRAFDVHHFVGDPSRAATLLGWRATTALDVGLARLIGEFRGADAAQSGDDVSGAFAQVPVR